MRIGFVGAGSLTKTFGRHLINAGHADCRIQFREGPETLTRPRRRSRPRSNGWVRRGKPLESDIVILATNWVNVPEALKDIDWNGRILIDATNAHMGFQTRS